MDVAFIAAIAGGLGAWLWQKTRRSRAPVFDRRDLAEDAQVAVHVAMHNAKSRQQVMTSLDLLYGLLQDEQIASAVATAGGDAEVLEDRVLRALSATTDEIRMENGAEAAQVLWIASMVARHGKRSVSCRDLWAYLYGTEAAALLDAEKPSRVDVLFAAVHGTERPLAASTTGDVFVVLYNDDYTTQEHVASLVRDVFGLAQAQAEAVTLETHERGKAIVARLPAARSASPTNARARRAIRSMSATSRRENLPRPRPLV